MPIVRNYSEVEARSYEAVPGVRLRFMLSEKDGVLNFSMRLFELPPGFEAPRHTHPWEHQFHILAGTGILKHFGASTPLREGDTVLAAPGEEIQVVNNSDGILHYL